MDEYISREELIKHLDKCRLDPLFDPDMAMCFAIGVYVENMKAADVQPLSVVAERIKNRLYETAYNTTEEKARNAIADMAGRIDFWIDELKNGDAD